MACEEKIVFLPWAPEKAQTQRRLHARTDTYWHNASTWEKKALFFSDIMVYLANYSEKQLILFKENISRNKDYID